MLRVRSSGIMQRSALSIGAALLCLAFQVNDAAAGDPVTPGAQKSIGEKERIRVVVRLRAGERSAAELRGDGVVARERRRGIAAAQQRIRTHLRGTKHAVRHEFRSLPYMVAEVDAAGLARLQAATGDVEQVFEDPVFMPALADSIPQIEADVAHQQGYDGSGAVIAIVDTGVDNAHPFLAGKVVAEACFADREAPEDPGSCPNGDSVQLGAGAGAPCDYAQNTCRHGTHVAGIAAGSGDAPGVAPSANIFALQVFHRSTQCGLAGEFPCARAFGSDITAALEYLYDQRATQNVVSVNMSLGGVTSSSACDAFFPAMTEAIENLRAAGIATIVASGNSSSRSSISAPACISSTIAVGAVDDDDSVAWFSNVSQDLDLFAPGVSITSSVPGGGFAEMNGTSMATPHVAGAWAVLRQANPTATVDELLATFAGTGRPTRDGRSGGTVTRPRIRLGAALGIEAPLPVLDSITPTSISAWGAGVTLRALGSDFTRASVVHLDGVPRSTLYVSDGELEVALSSADLQTQATSMAVTVVTPGPGGGTSASVPLLIVQPRLTVNRTEAATGEPVTVTLVNGTGVARDWIALARVGEAENRYVQYVYVGAGNTTFEWTVTMPSAPGAPGSYEFRLFSDGGYVRMATSATITVNDSQPPPPPDPPPAPNPPVLTVDATTVSPGASITVTLTNGTGTYRDWIAIARVGEANNRYLQYVYVPTGSTTFVWTLSAPSTPGSYEFRLFSAGGYTRLATSATITVSTPPPEPDPDPPPAPEPPVLSVDATVVSPGTAVTVTLANGTGVARDWIALARVGEANNRYVRYVYVPTGNTVFAWTVNMPSTAGSYEFRLFSAGGYTRLATSPTVQVVP